MNLCSVCNLHRNSDHRHTGVHPIDAAEKLGPPILRPPGFATPFPRLVRGRLRAAFSRSRSRSANVPSPLATNGDALSGFFAFRFFFLARGNVAVAPALAGPRGTTAARNAEPLGAPIDLAMKLWRRDAAAIVVNGARIAGSFSDAPR